MLGYRKANLDLANDLYASVVKVEFIKVEEDRIGQLMNALKNLQDTVKTYYEYDEVLIEQTELFIIVGRMVLASVQNYSTYFGNNNKQIVDYFSFTKKQKYLDLYKNNIEPIIELIKVLRKQENNAYLDTLNRMHRQNQFIGENTYLITKQKIMDEYIEINGSKIRIMCDREFVEEGIYADQVIFLGTPSFFNRLFSEVFYGKHVFFLGYSCFENRLVKRKSFSNLISQNNVINTIYKDVNLDKGFSGIDFKKTFSVENEKKSEDTVISQFENAVNVTLAEKVEVKIATVSHNNYIFLPLRQKVNLINPETFKITQERVKDLSTGDLLVFRTQNASGLLREVADTIMGIDADKYRANLEQWKRKLRFNVDRKGLERVSKILRNRYKIEVANENNVKNWMSDYSIKPTRLAELLKAFNFNTEDTKKILDSSRKIHSAHISAGHQISYELMNELDKDFESFIDENGFYTFESNEFAGASFNIEEIKKISKETYFISEKETLKIIKG